MSHCIYLLDNFDSFTYNLVDEVGNMGLKLKIYRNNVPAIKIHQQMQASDDKVILMLSPGPGTPSNAGCMAELLSLVQGQFPVLGICLGHQAIVEHYGGTISRANEIMHGKASSIEHCGNKMFAGLPQPLSVARYHSLMATTMPTQLETLAHFGDIPMAVYHHQHQMLGFQFHPESILSSQGSQLLTQSIQFLSGGV